MVYKDFKTNAKVVGERIKTLRKENALTQLDLSSILSISNKTLSQYETGSRIPSDKVKVQICDYFDVTLDYLLGREKHIRKNRGDSRYYFVQDVMSMMEISERKAYDIIHTLNDELKTKGKVIIAGRVPKTYFHLRTDVKIQEINREGKIIKMVV